MSALESVTLTIPRSAVSDVRSLTGALLDRMHELLERNTEGTLTEVERESLETLVQMAQFGQLIASALDAQAEAAEAR
mgnify:CR=1 FL=1|jgi:hypothetical protein